MFTVYSKKYCSRCDTVKNRLEREGVDFKVVDVTLNKEKQEELKAAHPENKKYPFIFVGDRFFGSEEDLQWTDLSKYSEVLLKPNPQRFVIFPIQHEPLWAQYKKAQASYWTAEELDLTQDMTDFEKLTKDERHFLTTVLAFFAASDGLVNENLCANFADEVQLPEARAFYYFQSTMETIHGESYSLLIDTYIKDKKEKEHLLNAIHTIPCVKKKADWALKWTTRHKATFGERVVAFACVEGVQFSSSFCAIFWLKKRGLMNQGLGVANELISKDEGMHMKFACSLFKMLKQPPTNERVIEIVTEAVEIELEFCTKAIPVRLIGMNSESMQQYVKFVADVLLVNLGLPKHYNVTNPFDWMDLISMLSKDNFFERRVTEYSMASSFNAADEMKKVSFSDDIDF